ncbi:MAG: hypothetical protein LBE34_01705 [Flavobacteriaceae bacterium]|jgi:hypothetical protein|nr:hypothetical protein [Flavobacteriaceae bacterium]
MNLEVKTTIHISTSDWNRIITYLKQTNWRLKKQYWGFDKGIDYDYYHYTKQKQEVKLAWCNWFEGEMQTTEDIILLLANELQLSFTYGAPEHL